MTLILPKDNEKDLADIPKNVLDSMNVNLVETMDQVLQTALAGPLPAVPPPDEPPAMGDQSLSTRH
jgi:ATP-dependent Lon protease